MAPFLKLLKKWSRFKVFKPKAKNARIIPTLPTELLRPILSRLPFIDLIHARAASRLFNVETDLILNDKYAWIPGQRVGPVTASLADNGLWKQCEGKRNHLIRVWGPVMHPGTTIPVRKAMLRDSRLCDECARDSLESLPRLWFRSGRLEPW
ncbi:hypothetical protein HK104_001611 [Borealophlyctis nickersoniae]|nr:hypothetical protein HK104_001611 [Borealophlyctis nickersoniae]